MIRQRVFDFEHDEQGQGINDTCFNVAECIGQICGGKLTDGW